jgi:hypothetical protein
MAPLEEGAYEWIVEAAMVTYINLALIPLLLGLVTKRRVGVQALTVGKLHNVHLPLYFGHLPKIVDPSFSSCLPKWWLVKGERHH